MAAGAKLSGRRLVVVIVTTCVLLYAVVVALYAVNDVTQSGQTCSDDYPADRITLSLTPKTVDAAANRITATLDVVDFGPYGGQELPTAPITIFISGVDGPRSYTFDEGVIPSPISIALITEGFVQRWPFDSHTVRVGVLPVVNAGTDRAKAIEPFACGSAHVPGWTLSSVDVEGSGDLIANGEPVEESLITAQRSVATVAFGIVILGLMIVLPVLGLTVAIRVYRGERKAEATLMSWVAAILFATLPLRGFLPGAPPIGSWVDYLVVLWVVAGLVASLVIYALGWLKWAPRGEKP